jgi:hypothetical protein
MSHPKEFSIGPLTVSVDVGQFKIRLGVELPNNCMSISYPPGHAEQREREFEEMCKGKSQ